MQKTLAIFGGIGIVLSIVLIYGHLFWPQDEAEMPRQFALFKACQDRYPDNNDHYLDCVLNQKIN